MQKKKLVFAGIILCLVVIAATAFYWYQKPRSGLANIKPAYIVSAKDLYNAFQQDEKKANEQFLEKVIQVNGTVDNVQLTDSTISLLLSSGNEMCGVNCSLSKAMNAKQPVPAKGAVINIKGRCVGFLMDVNLVDALIEP